MFGSLLRYIHSLNYHVNRILHKNIFIRSVVALSIPAIFIIICGSYIGWNTSITAVKFDLKLVALIIGGSILCAFDGFWYVKSFFNDSK